MINLETFLFGLLLTSALSSLVTEGIKKILTEHDITYRANTLVGIVASVLSAAIGVGYTVYTGGSFNGQVIVGIVEYIGLSWLCAMVGYDKVVQTISQFKPNGKDV